MGVGLIASAPLPLVGGAVLPLTSATPQTASSTTCSAFPQQCGKSSFVGCSGRIGLPRTDAGPVARRQVHDLPVPLLLAMVEHRVHAVR